MAKKKKRKNGKLKTNGNVGGKADVHLSSNGGRNKSLLGHNAIFNLLTSKLSPISATFNFLFNQS